MAIATLSELYRSRLDDLRAFSKALPEASDCDGPFLMDEPSQDWLAQSHRLLVVGQETNTWVGGYHVTSESDLAENQKTYRDFNFGENYNNVFFRYAKQAATEITGSPLWMWTNLFKFGKSSGPGAPAPEINDFELRYFDVLRDEIEVLNPTCVLFMSGPDYDHFLKQRIPDASFSPISDTDVRKLSRVSSSFLPAKSYRVYHPGYGNRHREMYDATLVEVTGDYARANS